MSSGCGDVLSLADLQTAKKHQIFEAEVITGKSGGVAGGADIDYATNQVTGQTQKTLPAVLRDLGFSPVAWDLSTGGTLTAADRDKVVYDPVSKTWYSYAGALPVTVPAGFNPVGNADWKPQTDPDLRTELASAAVPGTSLVTHSSGNTVETELDNLHASVDSFSSRPLTGRVDFNKKTLFGTFPLHSKNGTEIISTWSYDYVYPQGFVFDEVTNELLIMYSAVYNSGTGPATNLRNFIDIYDSSLNYTQTVSAGYGFAEGACIRYVSGQRRIALSANGQNGKIGVFAMPATSGLTKYQELTKLFDTSATFGSQISANGDYVAVMDPLVSTNRAGPTFQTYSVFRASEFMTSASAARVSVINLEGHAAHNARSTTTIPKIQGICLRPEGIVGIGGSQWYASSPDTSYGLSLQYTEFANSGSLISNYSTSPKAMYDFITANVVGASFIEPEGIVYKNGNLYSLIAHTNPTVSPGTYPEGAMSIFIEGVADTSVGPVLTSDASFLPGSFNRGSSVTACYPYPVNPRTSAVMATADDVVQLMQNNSVNSVKIGIGIFGQTFTITTTNGPVVIPTGQAHVYTSDWQWFNIDVTNTSTGVHLEQYRISITGPAPWSWTKLPTVYGGSTSITEVPAGLAGAALQLNSSGSASRRVVTTGALTVENYYLTTSAAIVGGITVNAGGTTTFATTSDMRRKNLYGIEGDEVSRVEAAVDAGCAQKASFKEFDDCRFNMMIAQILEEYYPEAVIKGGDDEKNNPWMVDNAFLVPSLMIAIAQMSKRIKKLEGK